jgi:hypothetical protein
MAFLMVSCCHSTLRWTESLLPSPMT